MTMTEEEQQRYVNHLLAHSHTRVEAFRNLSEDFIRVKLDYDDYLALSKRLGFEIKREEEAYIEESLEAEFARIGRVDINVTKPISRA